MRRGRGRDIGRCAGRVKRACSSLSFGSLDFGGLDVKPVLTHGRRAMKRATVAARVVFAAAMVLATLVAGSTRSAAALGTPVVDQEFTSPDNLDALINGC